MYIQWKYKKKIFCVFAPRFFFVGPTIYICLKQLFNSDSLPTISADQEWSDQIWYFWKPREYMRIMHNYYFFVGKRYGNNWELIFENCRWPIIFELCCNFKAFVGKIWKYLFQKYFGKKTFKHIFFLLVIISLIGGVKLNSNVYILPLEKFFQEIRLILPMKTTLHCK